jgi:hypothetical protein
MTAPVRIQRRRTKGWRMPPNTVCVTRGTQYGNPFIISKCGGREEAIRRFRVLIEEGLVSGIEKLRGKNLACFCPIDQPCHADVLLEIANRSPGGTA